VTQGGRVAAFAALAFVTACQSDSGATVTLPPATSATSARRDEPPVPLDPEPPVQYPGALAQQRIGGTVLLRMVLDSTGRVVAESTRVQESSGYPALDSAALAAAPRLRYAPALRNGVAVATAFLQPFNFRPPPGGGTIP